MYLLPRSRGARAAPAASPFGVRTLQGKAGPGLAGAHTARDGTALYKEQYFLQLLTHLKGAPGADEIWGDSQQGLFSEDYSCTKGGGGRLQTGSVLRGQGHLGSYPDSITCDLGPVTAPCFR